MTLTLSQDSSARIRRAADALPGPVEYDVEYAPGQDALVYLTAEGDPFAKEDAQPVARLDLAAQDLPEFRIGLRGGQVLLWFVDAAVSAEWLVEVARECVARVEAATR